MLSHHRTQGAGALWETAGTTKHIKAIKIMELAVEWQHLLPSLFPSCLLLGRSCTGHPARGSRRVPSALGHPCQHLGTFLVSGESHWPGKHGNLGLCEWKNPLCLLSLAFSTKDHLSGLEFCLEESGREPEEQVQYQGHLPGLLHWEHNDFLICLMLLFLHICRSRDWKRFK